MKPTRFGILGCANIAKKNVRSILRSGNCKLVAIASRVQDKAEQWAQSLNLGGDVQKYGSYEELLADPNVDAVYIPLPTTAHLEWCTKAAKAGKHILCEKPVAVTAAELQLIEQVCRDHKVFFMDGVMYMHHRRLLLLLQSLHDPVLKTQTYQVNSSFSFRGDASFLDGNIRVSSAGDPLGVIGDLGWYQLRLALLAFSTPADTANLANIEQNGAWATALYNSLSKVFPPSARVEGTCHAWAGDVPLDCTFRVEFPSPADHRRPPHLLFDCSFLVPFRQSFEIVAMGKHDSDVSDKIYRCDDMVLPENPSHASIELVSQVPSEALTDRAVRFMHSREQLTVRTGDNGFRDQESEMFVEFGRVCQSWPYPGHDVWSRLAAATQILVDACMQAVKTKRPVLVKSLVGAGEFYLE